MANLARDARDKVQATLPGATVHSRGKRWIKHQHPTDDSRFVLDTHVGPIHYGPTNDLEIDTAWVPGELADQPWLHKMVHADFNVYAGPGTTEFDAGQIVRYVHPDSGEEITFQPQQLQWTNDLDQIEAIADPQTVTLSSVDDDTLYWDEAFGPGLDFRWEAQTTRLAKYITVQSAPAIGAPPQYIIDGGNPVLKLEFLFQVDSGVDVWIDDQKWDKKSSAVSSGDIEFRLASTGEPLWWFKQATAVDAEGEQAGGLEQRFRRQGNTLFVAVCVPWSWLQSAVYPIEIDPTVDPQVGVSADDAYQNGSTVIITGGTGLVHTTSRHFGARWSVAVPNGATIDVSYASIYSTTAGRAVDYTMSVQDADTAAAFTTTDDDITDRTAHATTVDWDNGGVSAGVEFIDTDSLNTPVEGVVGRAGWSSGNYICCYYTERSGGTAGMVGQFYDGSSTNAPKLHIEYSTAGGGISIPVVMAHRRSQGVS